ncbi:MAG: SAM-dependent methyltransferase, partial [Bacteroidia bacterium]
MKIISHNLAKKILFYKLAQIKNGSIKIIEGNQTYMFGDKGSSHLSLTIEVSNPQFYTRVIKNGSIGAAEAFMLNEYQVSDLSTLIQIFIKNYHTLSAIDGKIAKIKMFIHQIKQWRNKNTVQGSKRNIIKHYDLGNDLFSLFLDSKMMYSSAIYPSKQSTLEEASEYKLKIICEKLRLKPDDHVLEIGTGWGGFAIYAATHYGCNIITTTISNQQYELAKQRICSAGLTQKIQLLKKDYRELTGEFDKIVSIEMLEAVGHQYLPTYFKQVSRLLKPQGTAL